MGAGTWVVEWLRGPWMAWDCCVLHWVVCPPGSHLVPMATSPFSVPYLTVSAKSKLFTLFLSREAFCPSWTAHFGDISLCPTSCGEGQKSSCWSQFLVQSCCQRRPICIPNPTSPFPGWKQLSKGLDLTLVCKRRTWLGPVLR